jgi:hypothetical protein
MSFFSNTSTGAALRVFIVETSRQMAFYVAIIHYVRDYFPFVAFFIAFGSTNDLQE